MPTSNTKVLILHHSRKKAFIWWSYEIPADYLYPLRSGDVFYVTAKEKISKLRFGFSQDIFRSQDTKPILKAQVIGTSFNAEGMPCLFKEIEGSFE